MQAQAPQRYAAYVRQRSAFFDALVALYNKPEKAQAVTPQFRQGIAAARTYVNGINAALSNPPTAPQGQ